MEKTYTEEKIIEYLEHEFATIGKFGVDSNIDDFDEFEYIIDSTLRYATELKTCGPFNDYGVRLKDLSRLFDLCDTLERIKATIVKDKLWSDRT